MSDTVLAFLIGLAVSFPVIGFFTIRSARRMKSSGSKGSPLRVLIGKSRLFRTVVGILGALFGAIVLSLVVSVVLALCFGWDRPGP